MFAAEWGTYFPDARSWLWFCSRLFALVRAAQHGQLAPLVRFIAESEPMIPKHEIPGFRAKLVEILKLAETQPEGALPELALPKKDAT